MELPFDINNFFQALDRSQIFWRKHTIQRMLERRISQNEVKETMKFGEIIQIYNYDKPFPSILMLWFPNRRPIHVVCSFDEPIGLIYVITAYEPSLTIFESDFKTKKS